MMGCTNSRPTNYPRPKLTVRQVSDQKRPILRSLSPRPMTEREYEEYKARNKWVGGPGRGQRCRIVRGGMYEGIKVMCC